MEQVESLEQQNVDGRPEPPSRSGEITQSRTLVPQSGGASCGCASANGGDSNGPPAYIYAIGRVEARFPSPAIEKEFAQATGRSEAAGKTDQQEFHAVLTQPQNRYLLRQLCWVFSIEGLETFILQPRDMADLERLAEAIRPSPSPMDVDVIIGYRGPVAPPE